MATTSPISSTTPRIRKGVTTLAADPARTVIDDDARWDEAHDQAYQDGQEEMKSELREKVILTNGLYEVPVFEVSATGDTQTFAKAPKLHALALELIETCKEFKHLRDYRFEVLWRAKGGTRAGEPVIAHSAVMGGLGRFYGQAHFLIWFAADNCKEHKLTLEDYRSAMHHELCHCGIKVNDSEGTEKPTRRNGIEVFPEELARFGLWRADLQKVSDAMAQQTLWASDRQMAEGVL
jgi:hypothetical protein